MQEVSRSRLVPLLPICLSPSGAIDIFEGAAPFLSSRKSHCSHQLSTDPSKLYTAEMAVMSSFGTKLFYSITFNNLLIRIRPISSHHRSDVHL